MLWMRSIPNMPALPSIPSSNSTTTIAPHMRKRMVKLRINANTSMLRLLARATKPLCRIVIAVCQSLA